MAILSSPNGLQHDQVFFSFRQNRFCQAAEPNIAVTLTQGTFTWTLAVTNAISLVTAAARFGTFPVSYRFDCTVA